MHNSGFGVWFSADKFNTISDAKQNVMMANTSFNDSPDIIMHPWVFYVVGQFIMCINMLVGLGLLFL